MTDLLSSIENPVTQRVVERAVRGPDPDVHEWLAESLPEYDWLIPGLLERGDRVIITGGEGDGKSTLIRQWAVQFASGIHPFGGESFEPVRVLFVDLENGQRHSRRKLRALVLKAGPRLRSGKLIPIVGRSLDLLVAEDQIELAELVRVNIPEVLVIGPLYKLAGGDPNLEETARTVAGVFDELRSTWELAVILEAHSPHHVESMRPFGASLWKRWPEFGMGLTRAGALRHWRGARDERDWPSILQRGGEWPWTALENPSGVRFAQILAAVEGLKEKPTVRGIEDLTGIPKSTVGSTIKEFASAWEARWQG